MFCNYPITRAAKAIKESKALVITAGAGMGVDSGLPDFRGPEGFWRAYPPLKERNLTLPEVSTPHWFNTDPHFAWGFFGHRLKLYRETPPHEGFQILKKWGQNMELGYFVFTSNVDGHFQKAGFPEDKVVECHGSINHLQATKTYRDIWPVPEDFHLEIDDPTLSAKDPLPSGPSNRNPEDHVLARPNILMFNDWAWLSSRTEAQEQHLQTWWKGVRGNRATIIEIGSSDFVPTVRNQGKSMIALSGHKDTCLIRINPRDFKVRGAKDISVPMKALEALNEIDEAMSEMV